MSRWLPSLVQPGPLLAAVVVPLLLSACSSMSSVLDDDDEHKPGERKWFAKDMVVSRGDDGRKVIEEVPPESVLERFDMIDDGGRRIAYVAFTDTEVGGIVFVDNVLHGSVSRRHAHAFYSCRGYATATGNPWGSEASAWAGSLLMAAEPVQSVELLFTGKGAMQSLKDLSSNAMVSQLRSLIDMGTNPLSVLKTASRMRSDYKARAKYEKVLAGLRSVTPGQPEAAVAAVARPEDVAFVPGGLVMAYQRFLIEFYLSQGQVKVIQQPSLHQLSRTYGGLFYLANTDWTRCTPPLWRDAVTDLAYQHVPSYTPSGPASGDQ